ncbi:ABC transporter permease [Kocuria sp.]|uniref:ABC transporter permease n=1 Tax=Kocuria sp. TaxID=1871328 RepID=UPI0026DF9D59|nr:ABC transporter permease [Kocuria sp.]MDO5617951.1 ABC transporter permease [Kocuria sp.]
MFTPLASVAPTTGAPLAIPTSNILIAGHTPLELMWFIAGLAVITALAVAIQYSHGMRLGVQICTGILRAALQLSIIAVLLRGILSMPWTVVFFIALMLTTASLTSISRLRGMPYARKAVLIGVLTGGVTGTSAVFALHLVSWNAQNLIAVAGILIGNAMTAATLSGRAFREAAVAHRAEVEAWFSLGAVPGVAYRDIAQRAARNAVVPSVDQTRATGLVTLPGAFVGALFGGASPVEAAMFQLVVLAGILLVQAVCTVTVTRTLARNPQLIDDVGH